MLKCPQLSKLLKAPRFKSINFRRQTPGSPAALLSPWVHASKKNTLDPSHPLASLPPKAFPNFISNALGIRAYPMALLEKPQTLWPHPFARHVDTWDARLARSEPGEEIAPMILNNPRGNRVPMSLLTATSKKKTSKKKCVRVRINRKLKTALTLIVVRGAQASDKGELVLNADEALEKGHTWILPGWSYVFFPTLEVYRMEYPKLVMELRRALRAIWEKGSRMESTLPTIKPLPGHDTPRIRRPPSFQANRTPNPRRSHKTDSPM